MSSLKNTVTNPDVGASVEIREYVMIYQYSLNDSNFVIFSDKS